MLLTYLTVIKTIYPLSTLLAKAKLDGGPAHNLYCDINKPRRSGCIYWSVVRNVKMFPRLLSGLSIYCESFTNLHEERT